MGFIVFCIGLIVGCYLIQSIKKIRNHRIDYQKSIIKNILWIEYISILLNGILFLLSYNEFGWSLLFLKGLVLDSFIIFISLIDIEFHVIPNFLLMGMFPIGIFFSLLGEDSLLSILGGMFLGGGILFLLFLIPKAMGGGDVKYMFVLGLYLGFYKTLMSLYIAFIIGGILSLLLLVFKVKKKKEYIPFGPFLSIGSFIAYHYFEFIINIIKHI